MQNLFFFFFSLIILAQSVHSTTNVLPSSLFGEILYVEAESRWHLSTSWRKKIILSAVYRVYAQLCSQSFWTTMQGRACRQRGGMQSKQQCDKANLSGLSDAVLKLIWLFTFALMLWKAMAYHLVTQRRGVFSSLFLSFFHLIRGAHSIFYWSFVAELDFVFANTFYGLF